ncbi:ZIP-like iron-zinc transporter [Lactarius akahatsu]|uniref:ZIP-like iron-zinc transporter n=1 Tax=Lactarius akahatsu TaxID=416441 RepID=A0AAD4LKE1_9AGAM|nr:ZIP-like iron-zinc transporter [Lactarius akahatsu]
MPTPTLSVLLSIILFCFFFSPVSAGLSNASKTLLIREAEIAQCSPVQQLSALKKEIAGDESPVLRQVFAVLFPFGPAWNSVLGTFYISSVPNFILAFIPAQINRDTLNTMTAFATGGLLSDVFLHLVPHCFLGEHQDETVHFVMVEEKRNILVGLGIFAGFAAFFIMEKSLRVLGGGEGHAHSHDHSNAVPEGSISSAVEPDSVGDGLRSRHKVNGEQQPEDDKHHQNEEEKSHISGPSKLSAYLNLFGDFVHNMMAASFYSSPLIGATTTLACFAHEIPHEIADYSILIRSGFTKRQAMQSQFLTAIGAFDRPILYRTFMGITIHNLSASAHAEDEPSNDLAAAVRQTAAGLLGTTVQLADLVIPFVAGGFLYIGAVAVLPTLLEESKSGKQALREFGAMAFGVLCMFLVAWNE